jgi:hypothetical protein
VVLASASNIVPPLDAAAAAGAAAGAAPVAEATKRKSKK